MIGGLHQEGLDQILPSPDWVRLQLATGRIPFPDYSDPKVTLVVSQGKRPRKPRPFEAEGITSKVWKVAKKCWHEKAAERPEVKLVLHDLEKISNPGVCTHKACTCSPWEIVDF
jgi:hypothetical protein